MYIPFCCTQMMMIALVAAMLLTRISASPVFAPAFLDLSLAKTLGLDASQSTVALFDSGLPRALDPGIFGPPNRVQLAASNQHCPKRPDGHSHAIYTASIITGAPRLPGVAPGARILVYSMAEGPKQLGLHWPDYHFPPEVDVACLPLGYAVNTEGGWSGVDAQQQARFADFVNSNRQVPIVVSSGNDGLDEHINFPAAALNVISVGAVSSNRELSAITSWSYARIRKPDIFTIGVEVLGISPAGRNPQSRSGTSAAAPVVAGAIVLLQQLAQRTLHRRLNRIEVKQLLVENGDKFTRHVTGPILNFTASASVLATNRWQPHVSLYPETVEYMPSYVNGRTEWFYETSVLNPFDEPIELVVPRDFVRQRVFGGSEDVFIDMTVGNGFSEFRQFVPAASEYLIRLDFKCNDQTNQLVSEPFGKVALVVFVYDPRGLRLDSLVFTHRFDGFE